LYDIKDGDNPIDGSSYPEFSTYKPQAFCGGKPPVASGFWQVKTGIMLSFYLHIRTRNAGEKTDTLC
jgi:hypothetical protein